MKWMVIVLFVGSLFSCTSEQRKKMREKRKPARAFLFHMEHFENNAESRMSFPIWFDDTIIKKNKIKSIERRYYKRVPKDTLELPRESRLYSFSESGALKSVNIRKFYESVVVENVTFNYSEGKDKYGFAVPEVIDDVVDQNDKNAYILHNKEKYAKKFLVYSDATTGNYLFYMLNKKDWGALSVDSVLRPTPEDVIVLGSPFKPNKKYQVQNTVKERNVTEYSYKKKGKVIQSLTFESYPFHTNRYINYDDQGYCIGYIDSTFSDAEFLIRSVSTFTVNEKKLPTQLGHKKSGDKGVEYFVYEFYR